MSPLLHLLLSRREKLPLLLPRRKRRKRLPLPRRKKLLPNQQLPHLAYGAESHLVQSVQHLLTTKNLKSKHLKHRLTNVVIVDKDAAIRTTEMIRVAAIMTTTEMIRLAAIRTTEMTRVAAIRTTTEMIRLDGETPRNKTVIGAAERSRK